MKTRTSRVNKAHETRLKHVEYSAKTKFKITALNTPFKTKFKMNILNTYPFPNAVLTRFHMPFKNTRDKSSIFFFS